MTSGEPDQKWFDENGEFWHRYTSDPGEPDPKGGIVKRSKHFVKGFLDRLHARKDEEPTPPF